MEKDLKELSNEIICRDSLLRDLYLLLTDDPMFQSLFIYGHVSCGKSLIIRRVLQCLKYNISIINCIEHTNNKSLFEKIIVDLSSYKLTSANNYKLEKKCDDLVEFISQVRSIAKTNSKPIVIVLEKCEKLRDFNANILPALLRLAELTQSNVCTIFTSDVIWEKYFPKIGMHDPVKLYFPSYTKDEIKKILLKMRPMDYSKDFYESYLNLFLSVFYRFCRDLRELRYMADKNFFKYIEPVENSNVDEHDITALWKNVSQTFKENLEVIYLRVSTDDFEQQTQLSREIESTRKLALSFELPCYAKFLLIAAFLASYNPAKEDKRLFMKGSDPKRKKKAYIRRTEKIVMNTREGPKTFPLNRMLAIFCSIIHEKIDMNAVLMTQIASMCQLGLLAIVGDSNIDEPKYKCCINYEFATVISENVNFELKKYLYDYLH